MSITIAGVFVTIFGTILVNSFGITDACSNEITAKIVEFAPMLTGSVMAYIGRFRLGGINILGGRTN